MCCCCFILFSLASTSFFAFAECLNRRNEFTKKRTLKSAIELRHTFFFVHSSINEIVHILRLSSENTLLYFYLQRTMNAFYVNRVSIETIRALAVACIDASQMYVCVATTMFSGVSQPTYTTMKCSHSSANFYTLVLDLTHQLSPYDLSSCNMHTKQRWNSIKISVFQPNDSYTFSIHTIYVNNANNQTKCVLLIFFFSFQLYHLTRECAWKSPNFDSTQNCRCNFLQVNTEIFHSKNGCKCWNSRGSERKYGRHAIATTKVQLFHVNRFIYIYLLFRVIKLIFNCDFFSDWFSTDWRQKFHVLMKFGPSCDKLFGHGRNSSISIISKQLPTFSVCPAVSFEMSTIFSWTIWSLVLYWFSTVCKHFSFVHW